MSGNEIITRGSLPHWYQPGYVHFVTYRTADSIPPNLMHKWREQRRAILDRIVGQSLEAKRSRDIAHKKFFQSYDRYLDRGDTSVDLSDSAISSIIRNNLLHHDNSLYQLIAWCIMPNHVHLLIQPFEQNKACEARADGFSNELSDHSSPLTKIMHSIKSFTATQINRQLNRSGKFWQKESYDHWVRDLDELERIVEYIRLNPVKAGLCETAEDWQFSSAHDRFCKDGSRSGIVGWLRDDWQQQAD